MYDQATETPISTVGPHHLKQRQADRQEADLYVQANLGDSHPPTNRGKDSRQEGRIPGDRYDDPRSPGEKTVIMKKIVWNDQFSVGVKMMDVQHQQIIRIFNKLVDNAQANAGSEKVSEVLGEMVEYASEHFKCEEQLLRDHEHPDLEQQKREHGEFRRQAGEFCLLASSEDEKMTHDLLNYLHEWWTNHILHEDKKYAALLEEKRSTSS